MTDAEIATELEQIFAQMPGMRRCFETWRGIGRTFCVEKGRMLSEAEFNRRFYELLCRTERRAQEHRARWLADIVAENLAEAAPTLGACRGTPIPVKASIKPAASPDRKPPQIISKKVVAPRTRPAPRVV